MPPRIAAAQTMPTQVGAMIGTHSTFAVSALASVNALRGRCRKVAPS